MDPITRRDVKAIFFMRPIDFYGPNYLGHGQIEAPAGFLYPRSPHSNGFCRSPMEIVAAFKLLINPRRRIAVPLLPCRFAHCQLPTQARTVSLRII